MGFLDRFRRKDAPRSLMGVPSRGWRTLWDSTSPTWQSDDDDSAVYNNETRILANWTNFACTTLIASDLGKLRLKLVEKKDGVWAETESPAFSPILRKPNHFQTRQKFIEQWVVSKLCAGNAYVLKERDNRQVVVRLYVLDPCRVTPLVSESGDVFYALNDDYLAHIPVGIPAVPASEIIHDPMVCLFHPLCGVSPLFANALAARQGLHIQRNSSRFFSNNSQPGGVLTAPKEISDVTAERIKTYWESKFSGKNAGKVAVLGDGLTFEPMSIKAIDAQLIDQLKMSAEMVCATYHVPAYMVGAAQMPAVSNVEALQLQYYSQCLQALIESLEASLDAGLGLADGKQIMGTEFDLDDLLRMDSSTFTTMLGEQVQRGITKPNEARRRLSMPPVPGGDTPYMQQQNFGLEALFKRDSGPDPFKTATPEPKPAPVATDPAADPPKKDMQEFVSKIVSSLETQTRATGEQLTGVATALSTYAAATAALMDGLTTREAAQFAARLVDEDEDGDIESLTFSLAKSFDALECL